jgi:hypothetical protein
MAVRPWCDLADDRRLATAATGRNETMESRLDVITLAVADLERGLSFYRSLGLESKGIIGTEWDEARR